MQTKNKAAANTALLTITNVINRIIGFTYRIVLIRLAGHEAIGLFQMIMPTYVLFLVMASAGLPIAVTRLIAEQKANNDMAGVQRVFRTAVVLALFFGLAANLLLFILSDIISQQMLGDARTHLALLVIAPSLPLVSLAAVFRGYFQGLEEIRVVSISLILEEIVHALATLTLVTASLGHGPKLLAASFAAGSVLCEATGLAVYLVAYPFFRSYGPDSASPTPAVCSNILQLSLPATIGRLLQSLSQVTQSIIIPAGLRQAGWTAAQAAIAYGELTGMALSLLFVPSLFTISLAATLLPRITAGIAQGQTEAARNAFVEALTWTTFISLPIAAIFAVLGEPICQFLFRSSSAGQLLSWLAWGGILIYMQQITASTLQGLGKPVLPVIASLTGTLVSATLLLALIPIWQMKGAVIGLVGGFWVSGIFSLIMVQRRLPFFADWWPQLLRALWTGGLNAYLAKTIYWHCLANFGNIFFSLCCAGLSAALGYVLIIRKSILHRFEV